jgi:hypothetical protein
MARAAFFTYIESEAEKDPANTPGGFRRDRSGAGPQLVGAFYSGRAFQKNPPASGAAWQKRLSIQMKIQMKTIPE